MNIFHFFAIDFCEWARPGGGAANGQNRPKYGGFPPCLRRTRGRTARAGFPRAQARTGGKSIPVRQGFGRGAGAGARGRARKIGQRAGQDGAGGLPPRAGPDRWKKYAGTAGFWPPRGGRAGAGAQNRSARAGRGADMERRQHHCTGWGIAVGRGVGERAGGAKSVSAQGGTARAGFPRAQARTGGKSIPVRQGFGRGAGRAGRTAAGRGRTWGGGGSIAQAGESPRDGA